MHDLDDLPDSEPRQLLGVPVAWWMGGLLALSLVGGFIALLIVSPPKPPDPVAPKSPYAGVTIPTYQPPGHEGYVGGAACATCHAEIARKFAAHPMARSITRVDAAAEEARLDGKAPRIPGEQRQWTVKVADGQMKHHEFLIDRNEKQVYDQGVTLDYVVGSGAKAQAYMYQRGELLFMSPLNWYSSEQKWDLAPGYKGDDPKRFDRRITDECLSCHAGQVAAVERGANRYQSPAFHELSISCENCHGPGKEHVDWYSSGKVEPPAHESIIHPGKLSLLARESVCYQCHLQTAVRLPRYGRTDFDFRPGDRIDDIWTHLDTELGVDDDGKTRSVNHVQQMRGSRCFTESQGRMGCTSCHDPHSVPEPAERVDYYRQQCYKCHQDSVCKETPDLRARQENSCIACHMPARDAANISHVSQTDHRLLRNPDVLPAPSTEARDGLQLLKFEEPPWQMWEEERALALGAFMYLTKSDRETPISVVQNLLGLAEIVPEDGLLQSVLGDLAAEHNKLGQAVRHYDAARKSPVSQENGLRGAMRLYYQAGEWEPALQLSEQLIQLDPDDAGTLAIRADVLKQLGRMDEATSAARLALRANPTLIPVREWLMQAATMTGNDLEAQQQRAIIERIKTAPAVVPKP